MGHALTGALFLILFWILADVAPLYHTDRAQAAHQFYSTMGVACFLVGICNALYDRSRRR